jgi:hypothetical protein
MPPTRSLVCSMECRDELANEFAQLTGRFKPTLPSEVSSIGRQQ